MSAEQLNNLEAVSAAANVGEESTEIRFDSGDYLKLTSGPSYHISWHTEKKPESFENLLSKEYGVAASPIEEGHEYRTHLDEFYLKTIDHSGDYLLAAATSPDPEDLINAYCLIENDSKVNKDDLESAIKVLDG